jgi:hypothetical protein
VRRNKNRWEREDHKDFLTLVLETRDGEELGVGLAKKWNPSGCLHVTHTNTHTHTPDLDINTGKTGVAGSTMLQSGYDREDIETRSITSLQI